MASGYNILVEHLLQKPSNSEKGYSLVELMVALFLISGVALIISQFSTSYNSKSSSLRRVCQSYTGSIIGIVQEETPFREIISFNPTRTGATYRTPPDFLSGTRSVPDPNSYGPTAGAQESFMVNKWWNDTPAGTPNGPASGVRLQSFQLIQGSIRSLATIYNRNASVRCQFGVYAPLTSNAIPLPSQFLNDPSARIRIRIDPYRISTGASLCGSIGGNLVYPAPRGPEDINFNVFLTGSGNPLNSGYNSQYRTDYQTNENETILTPPEPLSVSELSAGANSTIANQRDLGPVNIGDRDLGLRMIVEMTYSLDGQNYSCQSSHGFEYPMDRSRPEPPNIFQVVVGSNNSIRPTPQKGLWDHCSAGPTGQANNAGTAQIQVGYQSGAIEPGVQFMCKDLSWIRTPSASTARCVTRSGSFISGQPRSSNGSPTVPRMNTTNNQQFEFTANKNLRNEEWVPCDRLTICGRGPTPNPILDNTGGDLYYTLSYSNLPFGCHMDFEAIAVDTAGNRSAPSAAIFLDHQYPYSNVSIAGDVFRVRTDEIYYPTCGNHANSYYVGGLGVFCPRNSSWLATDLSGPYGNGYYTCRNIGPGFGFRAGNPSAYTKCCEGVGCRPWN